MNIFQISRGCVCFGIRCHRASVYLSTSGDSPVEFPGWSGGMRGAILPGRHNWARKRAQKWTGLMNAKQIQMRCIGGRDLITLSSCSFTRTAALLVASTPRKCGFLHFAAQKTNTHRGDSNFSHLSAHKFPNTQERRNYPTMGKVFEVKPTTYFNEMHSIHIFNSVDS